MTPQKKKALCDANISAYSQRLLNTLAVGLLYIGGTMPGGPSPGGGIVYIAGTPATDETEDLQQRHP
jgi:hypothetical protein